MAKDYKYFLGSVGTAEAFKYDAEANEYKLAFVSKTLTDSGINISTTKDDIRGGQGAPIQFSFYHDPSVEITLTDIVWKPAYLEAQLGAKFEDDSEDYLTETVVFSKGLGELKNEPKALSLNCGKSVLIWGRKKGSSDGWEMITSKGGKSVELKDADGEYCVRYLGASTQAQTAEVTSLIVPQELFLLITAPIFAGDACSASKGKAAGHITFEVPRFQLNGAQEFTFNMSSNQTMSLSGIALASESNSCTEEGGSLLKVRQFLDDYDVLADIIDLVPDTETLVAGGVPTIYGIKKNSYPVKLDNSKLTFEPELVDGKLASGSYTVSLTGSRSADFTVE